ncbi:HNH endonuclease [Bacillus thuringiensis]|uniref:HNH endonuclease n=1 Tax=Bacillus thuringiensis TaxID=1428 RepID=UPI000BFDFE07|nr:HNH endonuclease [Bacillus thuringiensis]PGL88562.1 HNH endonuclease [Bacillus thuringiensis]
MKNTRRPIDYIINDNGCFICTSHKQNNNTGHIRLRYNKRRVLAHRFVYEQCFGDVPDDLVVRHKCDTPQCINPEHLEIGTTLDNIRDRVKRGRSAIGEMQGKSKLKEVDIVHIRQMYDWGLTGQDISKLYGVSDSTIYGVLNKKYWRHV